MATDKLHPINPNTCKLTRTRHVRFPWDIAVIGVTFVIVILLSASLYCVGASRGWGIQPTFNVDTQPPATVAFSDCLHFSIVTIATLGYGDYRPTSYGRLVSGIEVIIGIIIMGILVSRLVSRQQERLTRRLVAGQMNSEIQEFRDMLALLLSDYQELLSRDYPAGDYSTAADDSLSILLSKTGGLAKSLARYWRYEAKLPDLDDVVPTSAAGRMLGDIIEMLNQVANSVRGKSAKTVGEQNRIQIRNATESSLAIAHILEKHIDEEGIKHSTAQIYSLIRQLRDQLELEKSWVRI